MVLEVLSGDFGCIVAIVRCVEMMCFPMASVKAKRAVIGFCEGG